MYEFTDTEAELLAKYGENRIIEAYHRLCRTCQRAENPDEEDWRDSGCYLYPVTTQGEDCPYWSFKK